MFQNCYSLTSIDFSNINTENVQLMSHAFFGCKKIKKLDFLSLIQKMSKK